MKHRMLRRARAKSSYGASVDVADKRALEGFVGESAKTIGGFVILVANVSALAVQDNEEAWHQTLEIDMMHTVRAANAALPLLALIIWSVSGRGVGLHRPGTRAGCFHTEAYPEFLR